MNAEVALKAAHGEVLAQRAQIAELLGRIRDLGGTWSAEEIARIITGNGDLKRQVHELTAETTSLTRKLAAARDNIRFTDKRIADLEVQLIEQNLEPATSQNCARLTVLAPRTPR